jgi:hypothetical protein
VQEFFNCCIRIYFSTSSPCNRLYVWNHFILYNWCTLYSRRCIYCSISLSFLFCIGLTFFLFVIWTISCFTAGALSFYDCRFTRYTRLGYRFFYNSPPMGSAFITLGCATGFITGVSEITLIDLAICFTSGFTGTLIAAWEG